MVSLKPPIPNVCVVLSNTSGSGKLLSLVETIGSGVEVVVTGKLVVAIGSGVEVVVTGKLVVAIGSGVEVVVTGKLVVAIGSGVEVVVTGKLVVAIGSGFEVVTTGKLVVVIGSGVVVIGTLVVVIGSVIVVICVDVVTGVVIESTVLITGCAGSVIIPEEVLLIIEVEIFEIVVFTVGVVTIALTKDVNRTITQDTVTNHFIITFIIKKSLNQFVLVLFFSIKHNTICLS
jgi:hypothetical protein